MAIYDPFADLLDENAGAEQPTLFDPFAELAEEEEEEQKTTFDPFVELAEEDEEGYGKRADGTEKGTGFFGELPMKDGSGNVATEISVGVEFDGNETQIPTLVPTLNDEQQEYLLGGGDPREREDIMQVAEDHAKGRIGEGKPVFAGVDDILQPPQATESYDPFAELVGDENIARTAPRFPSVKQIRKPRERISTPYGFALVPEEGRDPTTVSVAKTLAAAAEELAQGLGQGLHGQYGALHKANAVSRLSSDVKTPLEERARQVREIDEHLDRMEKGLKPNNPAYQEYTTPERIELLKNRRDESSAWIEEQHGLTAEQVNTAKKTHEFVMKDIDEKLKDDFMWQLGEKHLEYSDFWRELKKERTEKWDIDPEFANSTMGQFIKSAGMAPGYLAMAAMGPLGIGMMQSSMYAFTEDDARQAVEGRGEEFKPEEHILTLSASAVGQALLERAFGFERIAGDVLKNVGRFGKMSFKDFTKQVAIRSQVSALEEAATEPTQGAWQDFIASISYDEGREVLTGDALKRRFVEAASGYGLGLMMGGGVTATGYAPIVEAGYVEPQGYVNPGKERGPDLEFSGFYRDENGEPVIDTNGSPVPLFKMKSDFPEMGISEAGQIISLQELAESDYQFEIPKIPEVDFETEAELNEQEKEFAGRIQEILDVTASETDLTDSLNADKLEEETETFVDPEAPITDKERLTPLKDRPEYKILSPLKQPAPLNFVAPTEQEAAEAVDRMVADSINTMQQQYKDYVKKKDPAADPVTWEFSEAEIRLLENEVRRRMNEEAKSDDDAPVLRGNVDKVQPTPGVVVPDGAPQAGYNYTKDGIEMWDIIDPQGYRGYKNVPEATVSRQTLEGWGYKLPPAPEAKTQFTQIDFVIPTEAEAMAAVDKVIAEVAPKIRTDSGAAATTESKYETGNGTPVPVNPDGTITVYHRTDVNPKQISDSNSFVSKENTEEIFVSTQPSGEITGYGENVIELRIPQDSLIIEDEFADELHFRVPIPVANKALQAPAADTLNVSKKKSKAFGPSAEEVTITDPESGGIIRVVNRNDGSPVSVLELLVPEEYRGKGVGKALQAKAEELFPRLQAQISSKAAAVNAYRLGHRMLNNPDATLEEIFSAIDEDSSVNMVTPSVLGPQLSESDVNLLENHIRERLQQEAQEESEAWNKLTPQEKKIERLKRQLEREKTGYDARLEAAQKRFDAKLDKNQKNFNARMDNAVEKYRQRIQKAKDDSKERLAKGRERMKEAVAKKNEEIAALKLKHQQKADRDKARAAAKLANEVKKRINIIQKKGQERANLETALADLEALVKELPWTIQGKFKGFKKLGEIKGQEAQQNYLNKASERLNKIMDQYLIKQNRDALENLIKRVRKNKKKPKEYAVFDTIKKYAEMPLEDALTKADAILSKDENTVEEREDAFFLQMFGGKLNSDNRKDFHGEEMRLARQEAEYILREGRSRVKDRIERKERHDNELREKSKEIIAKGEKILGEKFLEGKEESKKTIQKVLRNVDRYANRKQDSLEMLLDSLDSTEGRFSGFLHDTFSSRVFRARIRANRRNSLAINKFGSVMERVLQLNGVTGGKKALLDTAEAWETKSTDHGIIYNHQGTDDKVVPLSKWEGITMWMQWHDKTLESSFEKMGIDEDIMKKVDKFIGDDGKMVGTFLLNEYKKYGKELRQTVADNDNYIIEILENYSPIIRYVEGKIDETTLEMLNMKDFRGESVKNRSMIMRTHNTNELHFKGANDVFKQHVYQMNHYFEFAALANDIKAVFKNQEVRRAIRQRTGGNEMNVLLDDMFGDILNNGMRRAQIDDMVGAFVRGTTVGSLALRVPVFFKQLGSAPAYMNDMPAKEWLHYEKEFWKNPIENSKTLIELDYIQDRISNSYDRELRQVAQQGTNRGIANIRNRRDQWMFLTRYGDLGAILAGGWPLYQYTYDTAYAEAKKTMSNEEADKVAKSKAEKRFSETTARQQQDSNIFSLGYYQRGPGVQKMFTQYMTTPIQYHRNVANAIRAWSTKDAEGKRRITTGQMAKTVFIFHVLLPQIYTAIGSAFIGMWGDDDEAVEEFWRRQGNALLVGNLNSLFIVGDFIEGFIGTLGDKDKSWLLDTNIPSLQVIEDGLKGASQMVNAEDGGEYWEGVDEVLENVFRAYGVPYGQVMDFFKAAGEVGEGEAEYPLLRLMGWSDYQIPGEEDSD